MKYETVKERVAREVYAAVKFSRDVGQTRGATMAAILLDAIAEKRTPEKSADVLAEKCLAIVMAWDIRCVGKLRELFPDYFPPSLRKGPLVCDLDAAGDWCVITGPSK